MPRTKNESSSSGRPKRVTLQDIATVAGVHVMTVSDALSGKRPVAPATKERVLRIAKELNYIPNFVARALVTGRTGFIAVFSGSINEFYYGQMVHLLESHISAEGYKLILMRTPEVIDLVDATGSVAVDGAFAIDLYHLVDQFRSHQAVPCVSIGTYKRNFLDYVAVDLSVGVEQALRLMLNAGRQRIAYVVTAPYLALPSEVRARAYLDFMQETGLSPEIIDVDTNVFATVRQRLAGYIQQKGSPDALLCQNDETAMCAYRVLRDAGCRVPDDVMIAGCDGQLHMEYFDPPLSTIVQPMEEMCALAWEFLKQRMANPSLPLQQATLQGQLVARESLFPSRRI